jgi:hypothetical protein
MSQFRVIACSTESLCVPTGGGLYCNPLGAHRWSSELEFNLGQDRESPTR